MTNVTKPVTLPEDYWAVLRAEADLCLMHQDQVFKQAIRLLQTVNINARKGLSLAFVDSKGNVVRDSPIGLSELD